ncbi:MAG: efflux RND transporter periplasmic adaptor subunit [Phycisphaerales bacterium]
MSGFMDSTRRVFAWVWRHAGAGIALALIVVALWVGFRIGSPRSEAPDETPQAGGEAAQKAGGIQYYTCSMHPSVRLTDPNAKCPICFMDLIPVTSGMGDAGADDRITLSEVGAEESRVETAPVRRFFPTAEVRLYGKVTYDQTSVARLTAYFPGRIDRLFVNYMGVPVAKGDHLAEVYSPELLAAFGELRQASEAAAHDAGESEIMRAATEDTLTAAREKLRLFGLTSEQIGSVERGEYNSDRLTIYSPISGVVTDLAAREGDYLKTGQAIATVADLSRLWLDLEAYESQLPLLRWGQRVAFTVEAHPGETFEGRISFIEPMVDERTRTAAVRVAVDNADRRLKPGMFASAVARPRVAEGGAVVGDDLAGEWVCPMHPTVVKRAPGFCDICGMDLVPAESLGVVGDPAAAHEPLVIPKTAVLFTGRRSVVYVAVEGAERPTYEGRQVTLGPRAGDFYVVREGLREGERVVVHGAFRVDSAMQIMAKPSMMTPRDEIADEQVSSPASFRADLDPVYTAYLDVQESLADDDIENYLMAAVRLREAVAAVDAPRLADEALADWQRAGALLEAGAPAVTLDDARSAFDRQSQGVIALLRAFGHGGDETWRLVHCPMAFDMRGADWVQRGDIVDNPYFGAEMLTCGAVRETFGPRAADTLGGERGHD